MSETARLTPLATQERPCRAVEVDLCEWRRFSAPVLAAPVLRFQRVEFEEESRETSLHAHESAEEKTSRSSEGLALEQLFLLRESKECVDPDRSSQLSREPGEKSQTLRPFENRKGAATRKVKTASKGGPPAHVEIPMRIPPS